MTLKEKARTRIIGIQHFFNYLKCCAKLDGNCLQLKYEHQRRSLVAETKEGLAAWDRFTQRANALGSP